VIAVRQALARIAKNGNRASEVIGRIRDFLKNCHGPMPACAR
jgi:hypothetical protein